MRHRTVRRSAALLAVVLVIAAALFAWTVERGSAISDEPPDAAARGEALFTARCAACHTAEELEAGLEREPQGRRQLELFLADHAATTPDENQLIVEYLYRGLP